MLVGMILVWVAAIHGDPAGLLRQATPHRGGTTTKAFCFAKTQRSLASQNLEGATVYQETQNISKPRSIGNFILGEHGGPRMRYSTQQKEKQIPVTRKGDYARRYNFVDVWLIF